MRTVYYDLFPTDHDPDNFAPEGFLAFLREERGFEAAERVPLAPPRGVRVRLSRGLTADDLTSYRVEERGSLRVSLVSQRPDWDAYWMRVAHDISLRGTCDRKRVGAVVVVDNFIVSTGYNGAAPGEPHCDDVGHDLVKLADGRENCVRAVHAEENAVLQAAKRGVAVAGATLYCNTFPCWPCARKLITAGIRRVVYQGDYNNDARVRDAFKRQGVELAQFAEALP